MRNFRTCDSALLNTGTSKCAPSFEHMRGAILVTPGTKLPENLTAESLEQLVHADRPNRIYGIVRFTEYAKSGGEVQTAANGYDGEEPTGISARKDTFTLDKFSPELDAALTRCYNQSWDVYFFDEDNMLHGINDGTGVLAGYPMNSVYSDTVPFRTSSAKPSMTVTFLHMDAKIAKTKFDYVKLGFNINSKALVLGLTEVELVKVDDKGNSYKVIERVGSFDATAIYGPLIAAAGADVITGTTTAVTYDAATKTLTIAVAANADVRLKAPSVLFDNDIKGIEQV